MEERTWHDLSLYSLWWDMVENMSIWDTHLTFAPQPPTLVQLRAGTCKTELGPASNRVRPQHLSPELRSAIAKLRSASGHVQRGFSDKQIVPCLVDSCLLPPVGWPNLLSAEKLSDSFPARVWRLRRAHKPGLRSRLIRRQRGGRDRASIGQVSGQPSRSRKRLHRPSPNQVEKTEARVPAGFLPVLDR